MQNTGQASEKKSYRVILLLVVGLAAFSSAMKELNQVRDMTVEASNLVAQWKDALAPADPMVTLSVETCQNSRTLVPPPPLQALPPLPPAPVQSDAVDVGVPAAPPAPEVAQPAAPAPAAVREAPKPRRVARPAHDAAEVRVLLSKDDFVEKTLKDAFESDQSMKTFKTKNRRFIFVTPEGHDIILKTLNRGVNLRSAS